MDNKSTCGKKSCVKPKGNYFTNFKFYLFCFQNLTIRNIFFKFIYFICACQKMSSSHVGRGAELMGSEHCYRCNFKDCEGYFTLLAHITYCCKNVTLNCSNNTILVAFFKNWFSFCISELSFEPISLYINLAVLLKGYKLKISWLQIMK